MIPYKSPIVFEHLWPDLIWRMPSNEQKIYLTFDDGPIPELTPWVLKTLKNHDALATFFCVGENIERHPDIFDAIIKEGHSIGNHTQNHLNARKVPSKDFMENIEKCDRTLQNRGIHTDLFRPPYGRFRAEQRKLLKDRRLVMWNVLSQDYDAKLNPETILSKCIEVTEPGSIIVFHDNVKATKNLQEVLPKYLRYFSDLGYQFERL
ncbi:polysaccharide deacetylase family protein [Roseivirga misakiensis]|uniref:Polysaccharide deacetylase n=1 Tax=Roseivirga misakiensis TaxID=1563681 RepID=A0A1E5T1U7_9BACT|nr:polysaccharide deacetylase family protein [Roseivirga misakiensis]OEK05336.1 polysaccharide deacetylase [Roseivirga misakiensis]